MYSEGLGFYLHRNQITSPPPTPPQDCVAQISGNKISTFIPDSMWNQIGAQGGYMSI